MNVKKWPKTRFFFKCQKLSFFVNLKKKVKFKGIVNTKRSFDAKVVYRQGTVARGIAR